MFRAQYSVVRCSPFNNIKPHTYHRIQIVRLSAQSPELSPPPPHMQARCCSPDLGSRGRHTIACEGGSGETQYRQRGRHSWYSIFTKIPLFMYYLKTPSHRVEFINISMVTVERGKNYCSKMLWNPLAGTFYIVKKVIIFPVPS